jgi:Ca2+/Na+ antiporter
MEKEASQGGISLSVTVIIVCAVIALVGCLAVVVVVWRKKQRSKAEKDESAQLLDPSYEPCKDVVTDPGVPVASNQIENAIDCVPDIEKNQADYDDGPFHSSLWSRRADKSNEEIEQASVIDLSSLADSSLGSNQVGSPLKEKASRHRSSAEEAKMLAAVIKPHRKSSLERVENELNIQRPSLKECFQKKRSSQISNEAPNDPTDEKQADNLSEKPTESLNEKPVENLSENPGENSNEKADETLNENPVENLSENPGENSNEKADENLIANQPM